VKKEVLTILLSLCFKKQGGVCISQLLTHRPVFDVFQVAFQI
jgi:hypothetical protein